jgi:Holliday junction resolvase RusA-like endonuclease
MIQFTVPGLPQGKGRARATVIAGRARMYTPAKTANYEAMLRDYAHEAMLLAGYKPFGGPLRVTVQAVFPKAASWSKKKAAAAIWHTSKPDADNLLKCLDGLNGIVWRDDSQVASASINKVYSDDGSSCLVVQVEEL